MPSIPKRLRLRRKNKYADYPNIPLNNPHGGYRKKLPSNLITTTKYSLLTFIPKNLFEQFRRMTNCYFLLIVIITFIPEISPLTPWTSVLPLSFVLGVTALKEAYEDIVSLIFFHFRLVFIYFVSFSNVGKQIILLIIRNIRL